MDFRRFAKKHNENETPEEKAFYEARLAAESVFDKGKEEAVQARDRFNTLARQLGKKKRAVIWQHPRNPDLYSVGFSESDGMIRICGNTYPHKDKIKAAGGVYSCGLGWKVPIEAWEELSTLCNTKV